MVKDINNKRQELFCVFCRSAKMKEFRSTIAQIFIYGMALSCNTSKTLLRCKSVEAVKR